MLKLYTNVAFAATTVNRLNGFLNFSPVMISFRNWFYQLNALDEGFAACFRESDLTDDIRPEIHAVTG